MRTATALKLSLATALIVGWGAWHLALGNGGPFVVKSPTGDPAAKGVLARLDPTLKPTREERLRVVKEDLTIQFVPEPREQPLEQYSFPPLVEVTAAYQIENPTDEEVTIDFGFPILRGIYLIYGMQPYPDVSVKLDDEHAKLSIISNSVIYGIIRENAREAIEKGIAADKELAHLVKAVRSAWIEPEPPAQKENTEEDNSKPTLFNGTQKMVSGVSKRKPTDAYLPARENLRKYLTDKLHWDPRNAILMVEYASIHLKPLPQNPDDRWDCRYFWGTPDLQTMIKEGHLGPLVAIGEQKATQLFAQLASRFDKEAGAAYEAIFTAWGGDVRERSLDMTTGKLRPRELELSPPPKYDQEKGSDKQSPEFYDRRLRADPTVYARVDYLDPKAKISKEEKESCLAILKNLPVVFTFAPMNLLHYQVKFPPKTTRTVTVSYKQYAYADTRGTGSYQLAYVLHPATMWREFGPINLTLEVPKGIDCKASAQIRSTGEKDTATGFLSGELKEYKETIYKTVLDKPEQKHGELFVAIDMAAWDKMFPKKEKKPEPKPQAQAVQTQQ